MKINNQTPVFWLGISAYQGLALLKISKKRNLDYHIICLEKDSVYEKLKKDGRNIFCLEEEKNIRKIPRNTGHLLAQKKVIDYIEKNSQGTRPAIIFFKPSAKIKLICRQKNWQMISNDPKLAAFFENKISFYKWASSNKLPVISSKIINFNELSFNAKRFPFIIQLERGWAGKSSFLIKSEADLKKLSGLGKRKIKISPLIEGETYTTNGCVSTSGQVLVSRPATQINGIKPLCQNPLSTTGRQWPAAIGKKETRVINSISKKLGRLMYKKGYRGFFGVDFLIDKRGETYVLECNPRLTASFVFYTQLEEKLTKETLLWHHLSSFLNPKTESRVKNQPFFSGSEIIQRSSQKKTITIKQDLSSGHYSLNGKIIDKNFYPAKNKLLLITRPKGNQINPGDEMYKIISTKPIIKSGKIDTKIDNFRKLILSMLL